MVDIWLRLARRSPGSKTSNPSCLIPGAPAPSTPKERHQMRAHAHFISQQLACRAPQGPPSQVDNRMNLLPAPLGLIGMRRYQGQGDGPHRGLVNTRGSLAGMQEGAAGSWGRWPMGVSSCHAASCVEGGPRSASRRHRGLSYTI